MQKKIINFLRSIKTYGYKNKINLIIFFILLFLALITRFYKLSETAYFVNDQGRDLKVLYSMLFDKKLTLIGPATSMTGLFGNFYFGPYYYYFLFIFYLFNHDVYIMTALFPILFVIGLSLFLLVKEFKFNQKVIISLFLVSSWFTLFYSRFLWNLNLAFLLSFILFSIFLRYKEKIVKYQLLSFVFGLISGMIFQIHYGMLFLYVGFLTFFIKNKRNALYYFIGIVLSFLPFLIFDIRHDFVIIKNLASWINLQFEPHKSSLSIGSFFSIFVNIFDFYLFPSLSINNWLKIAVSIFIYFYVIVFNFRKKKDINTFVGFSFIVFFLSFFIFKRDFDYYMACFVIWFYMGLGLVMAEKFKTKIGKYAIILFFIFFVLLNLNKYFNSKPNLFGLSYQYQILDIIKSDLRKAGEKDLFISVFPHKDDVNSLEYLIKVDNYNFLPTSKKQYLVCYKQCKSISNKKIKLYSSEELSIYVND